MNIITTEEQLNEMVAHYLTQDAFAYDVETVGDHRVIPAVNEVSWISFATHGRGDVIPLGHPNGDFISETFPLTGQGEKRVLAGLTARPSDHSRDKKKAIKTFSEPPEQLFPAQVFKALKPLFFNEKILTIGHNLVFDLSSVAKYYDGAVPDGPYFDTLMASFLYDNKNKGKLGLDDCLERELGFKMVKGIGHMVEIYSFSDVAKYAYLDAKYTFLLWKVLVPKLTAANVNTVMNLEMDVLRVLCDMKLAGAPIDTIALQKLNDHLEVEIEHAKSEVYRIAGRIFNMNSNNEKQYVLYGSKEEGCRGLKTPILTGQGEKTLANKGEEALTYKDYSVSAEALEPLRDKDELCGALLDYADLSKLQSTYVIPYLGGSVTKTVNGKSKVEDRASMLINGKLYGDFIQWGAETGRFSCVSGDTLLPTNRGTFRFDEYVPHAGDLVLTHAGRWMPILQKIYKGIDQMYSVHLENGSVLHCTKDHRLLTYKGWASLGSLNVGDKVASYGSIKELCSKLRESDSGSSGLYRGGQAYSSGSGSTFKHHTPKCSCVFEPGALQREVEGGEIVKVLSIETGLKEPYEGQVWLPAPQLQGCSRELGRVSVDQSGDEVRTSSSTFDGSIFGDTESSISMGRSPYQRGQEGQQFGQLSSSDQIGTLNDALQESRIKEIKPLGTMGVWDIGVAGDESYLAHGFVNHNSRNPNLQNVPAPNKNLTPEKDYGTLIRNLFWAPTDYKLIVADYSQIEPRVLASMSNDPILMGTYTTLGVKGDIYTTIGETMGVDRKAGKVLVLAMMYGVGPDKIATQINCSVKDARKLIIDFSEKFPDVEAYKSKVIGLAKKLGYITTIMNRRRYLPDINSRQVGFRAGAERQAFNTRIQGSAADIIKLAMIRAHDMLPKESKLILTVHDELVTMTPDHLVEESRKAIQESMEGISLSEIKVPLIADIKVVQKWGEAK